jgi:predicted PurR-regulated permease PerM
VEILSSKKGTTIAEIIISFALLVFVFSMFFHGVSLSRNLTKKAESIRTNTQQKIEDFYKNRSSSGTKDASQSFSIQDSRGGSFTLNGDLYEYNGFYYWESR